MKKTLALSILSFVLAITIFAGSVYAWFIASNTSTKPFYQDVTGNTITTSFFLGGTPTAGEVLELAKSLPGDVITFEIIVVNASNLTKNISITLYEIDGVFTYGDSLQGNLMDIWELEYPLGTFNKLKDIKTEGTNNVSIVSSDYLIPFQEKSYQFNLRFGTGYQDGDINIFQSREMTIESLIVEEIV